jgi:hypothetical protein
VHRIGIAVSIFFAASVAHAIESRPEEARLRTMTIDPPTATSPCIGNPVTPLCAVETFVACYFWDDMRLCRAIGFTPTLRTGASGYISLQTFRYRAIGEATLKEENIPDWARKSDLKPSPWRSGDLALDVYWEACEPEDQCVKGTRDAGRKFGEGCPMTRCKSSVETYILRPIRGRWQFVSFWSPDTVQGKESWPNKPTLVPLRDPDTR